MANYYGTTRSNYFAVKDVEAFLAEMGKHSAIVEVIHRDQEDGTRLYGVMDNDQDGGGNLWSYYSFEDDEEYELDWGAIFSKHLADGWVAVIVTAGAEKHRYVSGNAFAYNNKGEEVRLDLSDIYTLAKDLGENITHAAY